MSIPIFLLAPTANMAFAGMPSGASYFANAYGLVTVTNGSTADEVALIAAGCVALLANSLGSAATNPVTQAANFTVSTAYRYWPVDLRGGAIVVTFPGGVPGDAEIILDDIYGAASATNALSAASAISNQTILLQQPGSVRLYYSAALSQWRNVG